MRKLLLLALTLGIFACQKSEITEEISARDDVLIEQMKDFDLEFDDTSSKTRVSFATVPLGWQTDYRGRFWDYTVKQYVSNGYHIRTFTNARESIYVVFTGTQQAIGFHKNEQDAIVDAFEKHIPDDWFGNGKLFNNLHYSYTLMVFRIGSEYFFSIHHRGDIKSIFDSEGYPSYQEAYNTGIELILTNPCNLPAF